MSDRPYSVLGLFDTAQQLLDAIPAVRKDAHGHIETYTPIPVHGLEEALGLKKSPVGGMVFVMGSIGALAALAFEMWSEGIDYPMVTAGKPYFSWEAFIPIVFETMVLFACFTSGLGMLLLLNRLPLLRHPMLRAKSMPAITRDKFALAVESRGEALDVDAVERLLRNAGAQSVEVVEDLPAPAPLSPRFLMRSVLVIALCCIFAGALTYWGVKLFPASIPMVHMLNQPRLDPQQASDFFKDGFGMRLPVAGTVARGHMPSHLDSPEAAAGLVNPLPRTEAVLLAGKRGFNTFCSVCHGILGNGQTSLTSAYGAKPANLISGQIQALEDGRIYYTIAKGKNAMPSYAADLTEDERWSVVHYVRVLQRAQNAKDTDFSKEPSK